MQMRNRWCSTNKDVFEPVRLAQCFYIKSDGIRLTPWCIQFRRLSKFVFVFISIGKIWGGLSMSVLWPFCKSKQSGCTAIYQHTIRINRSFSSHNHIQLVKLLYWPVLIGVSVGSLRISLYYDLSNMYNCITHTESSRHLHHGKLH